MKYLVIKNYRTATKTNSTHSINNEIITINDLILKVSSDSWFDSYNIFKNEEEAMIFINDNINNVEVKNSKYINIILNEYDLYKVDDDFNYKEDNLNDDAIYSTRDDIILKQNEEDNEEDE